MSPSPSDLAWVTVTDTLLIAGQPSADQIAQCPQGGIAAVVNLRMPTENGVLPDEATLVAAQDLPYSAVPLSPAALTPDRLDQAIAAVAELPKPILVHCASALRAAVVVALYRVAHEGLSLDAALAEVAAAGFDLTQKPPLAAAIQVWASQHGV